MKTKIDNESERFRAIEQLQSIRDCPQTGPEKSAEADYAINLVLNPSRKVDDYLIKNALRDAKRILGRIRPREERLLISFDSPISAFDEDGSELTLHDVVPASVLSPLEALILSDENTLLRNQFKKHRLKQQLMECLGIGLTLAEAASATGISLSYAKKLRASLRAELNAIGLN